MATGRKGPKAVDKKTVGGTNGGTGNGVVETVRSLAELVAEHSLTELIYDTPELTITLRRGAIASAAVPMQMPMEMQMPMQMPASMPASAGGVPFTSHHLPPAGSAPAAGAAAEPDNAHVVTSPFVGTFYRRPNPDSPTYVEINQRVDKGAVLCIVEYGQALFKIAPA